MPSLKYSLVSAIPQLYGSFVGGGTVTTYRIGLHCCPRFLTGHCLSLFCHLIRYHRFWWTDYAPRTFQQSHLLVVPLLRRRHTYPSVSLLLRPCGFEAPSPLPTSSPYAITFRCATMNGLPCNPAGPRPLMRPSKQLRRRRAVGKANG